MVRILSISAVSALILCLVTGTYYKKNNVSNSCKVRALTSNSFFSGVGQALVEKYGKSYNCALKFDVVNGANLISGLFNKQSNRYDVLIGLDDFQINRINQAFIGSYKVTEALDGLINNNNKFIAYDESPITFFLRGSGKNNFNNLSEFLVFLEQENLTIAIPIKTTSVLGALFEYWQQNEKNKRYAGKVLSDESQNKVELKSIKFVKSWSEGFGLFERKIVDGFLSFETSEIYFSKTQDVKKVSFKEGHPNLREYFAFPKNSNMSDFEKNNFILFLLSEEIQSLILKKNYMWPINNKNHQFIEYRNLKKYNLVNTDGSV